MYYSTTLYNKLVIKCSIKNYKTVKLSKTIVNFIQIALKRTKPLINKYLTKMQLFLVTNLISF